MAKCLVVDDVEVTRFTSKELLNKLGLESVAAGETAEAVSILQQGSVDVILLDWHIGKESGIDLLKQIRGEMGLTIPVIVFSGVEDQSKAGEALEAGANDFLSKPTTHEKLKDSMQKVGIEISEAE